MVKLNRLLLCSILPFSLGCASGGPSSGGPVRVAVQKNKIQDVPLERYIMGVLEKEMSPDWPLESLKAQAVASRTYVLYRKAHPRHEKYDVVSNTADQVYEKKGHYHRSVIEAVSATEGQVLKYDGKILEAFFHSACGGMSERADHVWPGVDSPPLLNVHEDPYCSSAPSSHWTYQLSRGDLSNLLNQNGYALKDDWQLEVDHRDDMGRVKTISLIEGTKKTSLPATTFRQLIGNSHLKSTLFEIEDSEDPVIFSGRGSGHGVGLCQWGAKGMADSGMSYRDILEFYYPGSELEGPRSEELEPPLTGEDISNIISRLPETVPAESRPAETLPH